LQATDDATGFAASKTVSRLKPQELPVDAMNLVMKADTQKLPAFAGMDVPQGGYVVYRIVKVSPGTPDVARRNSERQQMDGAVAQQETYAYVEALKRKAKASINAGNLASMNAKSADQQ
jgi:peptidyl-prolyl cis-trans isomerase D